MVYLDTPRKIAYQGVQVRHCHCVADSLEELHAFMRGIGVGPRAYHSSARLVHYDLFNQRIDRALEAGAQLLDRHSFMSKVYAMNAQKNQPG